jgi:hypothetical protein
MNLLYQRQFLCSAVQVQNLQRDNQFASPHCYQMPDRAKTTRCMDLQLRQRACVLNQLLQLCRTTYQSKRALQEEIKL